MLTPQDIQLAEQRAAGQTLENIGNLNNLPLTTTHRRLQRPEVKALIERIQAELIETSVPIAADNIKHAVEKYKEPATTITVTDKKGNTKELPYVDEQLREHGFKASQRLLESVGILPSHTPSVLIQQIFNQNDPQIGQELGQLKEFLLSRYGPDDHNGDLVIDVQPQDMVSEVKPTTPITIQKRVKSLKGKVSRKVRGKA